MSSPAPTTPPSNSTAPPPRSTVPPPPVQSPPPATPPPSPPPPIPSAPPPSTPPPANSPPSPPPPSSPPPLSPPSPPPRQGPPGGGSPPPRSSGGGSRPPPPPVRAPPSGGASPSPPSDTTGPPAANSGGGSPGISTGTVAGIAVGALLALAIFSLVFVCCKKKKKQRPQSDYNMPPTGPKAHPNYGAPVHNWQQNIPPPADHMLAIPPNPSPPSSGASKPPYLSNSGSSGSNFSGPNAPLPPPSPGMSFGFSKSTFTYEELAKATNGFSDANLLGQGGFGYVHKGVLPEGKEVAVKHLKAGSGQGEREFQAEVEIISRVHHRHLVSLVGYCMDGALRMLVYQFVPNNTLEFHLHGRGRPVMDWSTRMKIALGAAKGLAYLHEDCHPKIIHRDIKASNILLDFNFEAKVADFGLAKLSSDANTHVSTRVMGTFGYLAPEYAASGKLTEKSDVFSYGVMLLELITGKRPVLTDPSFMENSLVDWARPLLTRALEDGNYYPNGLIDERIKYDHNDSEMARMVACAAACVRHSSKRRPRMSQVVRALQGDLALSDLNEGIQPGHSAVYSSYESSDYDNKQYKEDMKRFNKTALASGEYGSTEQYSNPTSGSALNHYGSSSETKEREMGKTEKDLGGFTGGT